VGRDAGAVADPGRGDQRPRRDSALAPARICTSAWKVRGLRRVRPRYSLTPAGCLRSSQCTLMRSLSLDVYKEAGQFLPVDGLDTGAQARARNCARRPLVRLASSI
jgi:hypothetical protein